MSPVSAAPASARTATAIDALRRFWRGREVLILLHEFTSSGSTIIGELAGCGAEVAAVLTAAHPAVDAPAVRHLWSFADHGYQLTRDTFDLMLREPPAELAAWLTAVDPDRSWLVLGGTFTHVDSLCGRPVHGWRRPQWAALEDKTRIESLWREAGVPSPPHAVLRAGDPALPDVMITLDRGLGVVLALDSTRGFHGDSAGLRWVRNPREPARAPAGCQRKTDLLRVAEFMPGVPCSVLGMVFADGVAVFDPIEIVTLRDPARNALVFCGSSTWWRPGQEAADMIRRHARSAGRRLAALGFRGMFSVDGILNGNEFYATELNPRHASGLGLRAGWPRFPAYLFQRAMQEGLPGVFDLPWQAVEEEFRATIRSHPSCAVRVPVTAGASAARTGRAGAARHILDLTTSTFGEQALQTVAYQADARSVRVLSIDPPRPDGLAAPAVAALASAIGPARLDSCLDDSFRRTPKEDI